jgi:hypothetical protein
MQIRAHIDSFVDPKAAERGFDKFPVPHEVEYIKQASQWLKQREVMALAKANVNIQIDTEGLPGIFGKVSGDSAEDRAKYTEYAVHCRTLDYYLNTLIKDTSYLESLRRSCPTKNEYGLDVRRIYASHVSVDLKGMLFVLAYKHLSSVIDNIPDHEIKTDRSRISIEAGDAAVSDFLQGLEDKAREQPEDKTVPGADGLIWHDLKL